MYRKKTSVYFQWSLFSSLVLDFNVISVSVYRWERYGSPHMINVFYISVWKWETRCSSLQRMSAALLWTLHPAHWEPSYAATPRIAALAATVVNLHSYAITPIMRHYEWGDHPFNYQAWFQMPETLSFHSTKFSHIIHSVHWVAVAVSVQQMAL